MIFSVPYFSPRIINPVGWWDGSNPNGNGVIPSNNASLSQLVDLSGNSFHWPQSTGSLQPTYVANAYNNLGAINFSGAQYFSQPYRAALNGSNMSIFILCAVTSNTNNFRSILTSRVSNPVTKGYIIYAEPNQNVNKWSLWVGNNSGIYVTNRGPTITLGQLVLIRAFTNVASNSIIVNGTAYNDNPSTSYVPNDGVTMYLGCGESAQFPFPGRLCELVIYDRTLSSVEQTDLSNYFYKKWLNGIS